MQPPSKRLSQRHAVSIPVTIITDGGERTGTITNMSVGGIYVEDEGGNYAPRQVLRVRFSIPTLDAPIEVDVNVRWVNKVGDQVMGFGAQFLGLTAKEVWALTKFFSTLREEGEEGE